MLLAQALPQHCLQVLHAHQHVALLLLQPSKHVVMLLFLCLEPPTACAEQLQSMQGSEVAKKALIRGEGSRECTNLKHPQQHDNKDGHQPLCRQ